MAAPVPTRRSDGRSGRHIPKILAAELSRPDESVPQEMTFTENVGLHGDALSRCGAGCLRLACWLLFYGMAFRLKEGSFIVSAWKVATSPWG